jgi:hypothetical protein
MDQTFVPSRSFIDTFDGAKPRFLNRGKKRRSVSTLSIPRASDRGVEWVDFLPLCPRDFFPRAENFFMEGSIQREYGLSFGIYSSPEEGDLSPS